MQAAIAEARLGNTPFGCVLVKNDDIVVRARNTVSKNNDISAHAEMNAIREFCNKNQSSDLSQYTLYSTCEPCPMCMSAYVMAGISMVVYGAPMAKVKKFVPQIDIPCNEVATKGSRHIIIIPGVEVDACLELFEGESAAST
jgi:tRNA(Arg) A34 adenosine deaminase TadA